ncbi:ABC-2 family transporter protein [Poriferisphaera corsica]|uniref:ABC-2 family transporter protein n=1 Tax=Poriferisphaera corsica TaxID=2528020 RepID=A0A517YYK7_9BACT|nr:ABC-2 family transporter protein [Poriferisphaera corsica]
MSWLIVYIVSIAMTVGVTMLFVAQQIQAGAVLVSVLGGLFVAYWQVRGLYMWRHVGWVKRVTVIALATLGAGSAGIFYVLDLPSMVSIILGIYAMGVSMYLGIQIVKGLLSGGHPIIGVARTLVDEAIRMRVPLVFIIVLVLLVPILPFVIDPKDFLKYRIQTFLTASMYVTSVSLSLMTLFLAVQTITSELQYKQIYLTLTKPIGRVQYLLGKWLGIVMLNAVLVIVCGVATYSFTTFLAKQQALDPLDRAAVDEQILVARQIMTPKPLDDNELQVEYENRLTKLREQDPDVYGAPGSPIMNVTDEVRSRIRKEIVEQWFSLKARQERTYVFTGLMTAKEYGKKYGQPLQLRLNPDALGSTDDRMVTLLVKVGGLRYVFPNIASNQSNGVRLAEDFFHVLEVDSSMIDDLGQLVVTIRNPVLRSGEQPTISFKKGNGLEVYYRVGSFEVNLFKSMAMIWLKLVFLAMLGLTMGSFLGFPTACLAALLIYFAASGSEFLFESLDSYAKYPRGDLSWGAWVFSLKDILASKFSSDKPMDGVRVLIRMIGEVFMTFVPRFGYYSPTEQLTDGRVVTTRELASAFMWLGMIWTFVIGVIAYLIFRSRELARVTV